MAQVVSIYNASGVKNAPYDRFPCLVSLPPTTPHGLSCCVHSFFEALMDMILSPVTQQKELYGSGIDFCYCWHWDSYLILSLECIEVSYQLLWFLYSYELIVMIQLLFSLKFASTWMEKLYEGRFYIFIGFIESLNVHWISKYLHAGKTDPCCLSLGYAFTDGHNWVRLCTCGLLDVGTRVVFDILPRIMTW